MSCDPLVREILQSAVVQCDLRGCSIAELKRGTPLEPFSNKAVRRAVESAHYGHKTVRLSRPRIDEFNRGWQVSPV